MQVLKHPVQRPTCEVTHATNFKLCAVSFALGILVGLFLYTILPSAGVRYLEVLRSYWLLNWSHVREASAIQSVLNAFEMPFNVFSSGESALVQSAVSGAMGMALSRAIGYARSGTPTLPSLPRVQSPQRPRRREVLEVD